MSVLAVYESVEAMAGDEDALRRRLASLDGWVAGQADSGLVTTRDSRCLAAWGLTNDVRRSDGDG
jgi:hypothetical protein